MLVLLPQQLPGFHLHLGGQWQIRINAVPKDISPGLGFAVNELFGLTN